MIPPDIGEVPADRHTPHEAEITEFRRAIIAELQSRDALRRRFTRHPQTAHRR